jgi:putative phosphotransacetylase
MERSEINRLVELSLIKQMARTGGEYYIPAAASNRHIHLTADDVGKLFGAGYELSMLRPLSQPGQYACKETLTVVGSKGSIDGVRVLGPPRPAAQVEISLTDAFKLGIEPVVRMSGDIAGTPGCTLVGPSGQVTLNQGVIIAARHLHISNEETALFGIKNGDVVNAKKTGARETVFGNIIVRADKAFSLELHLDTDEANAAGIKNGDLLELIK